MAGRHDRIALQVRAASLMKQLPSTNTLSRWEHFPHDADVGIRGFGPTAAAAFEQAACALTAAVTSSNVEPKLAVEVSCEASDLELLFVEWLNRVIYEMTVRRIAVRSLRGPHRGGRGSRVHSGASRWTSGGTLRRASRKAQLTQR